jgi:Tfp pilus assembly protein PilV
MRFSLKKTAFSLIEVTFALGIIVFCCVAMLSLLTVGFNSARDSADDSQAAMLYEEIVRQIQLKPFNTPAPTPADGSAQLPLPNLTVTGTTGFLVDQNLHLTTSVGSASKFVKISVSDPPLMTIQEEQFPQPYPRRKASDGKLAEVKVDISWPASTAYSAYYNPGSKATFNTATFTTQIGSWEDQ